MSQALAQPLIEHRDAIARVCREHGVERLEAFGSAADGRFDPARSDFDFIVTFSAALQPSIAATSSAWPMSLKDCWGAGWTF